MSSHANTSVIERAAAAFNSGDLASLGAVFTDDAVWHSAGTGPLSGRRQGRDDITAWFAALRDRAPDTKAEPLDAMADDRFLVFVLHVTGSGNGKTLDQTHANACKLVGDQIAEGWFLVDDQAAWDDFLA